MQGGRQLPFDTQPPIPFFALQLVVRQDVMAQHGVDQHQATAKPASRQGRTFVAPVRQDVRRLHLAASSKANAVQQVGTSI